MIKKINAIIAFLVYLLILIHVIMMGGLMIGFIPFNNLFSIFGITLLVLFSIHVLISCVILFFFQESSFKYPKLNYGTIIQRVSALLLIVIIHFHMHNYFVNGELVPQSVLGLISELLLVILFGLHFYPSIEKGLISLGINNKVLLMVIKVFTIVLVLFMIISILFYFLRAL